MGEQADMTPKQARFVEEYLIDLNGTQAAIRAGYSAKTAEQAASRLLSHVKVSAAIAEALANRSERTQITADYVLTGLKEVAERCMQRVPVMVGQGKERTQLTDEDGRDVWAFDASGANKSFELLGKHLKLFTDKHEHAGVDGKPIRHVHELTDEALAAIALAGK